MLFIMNMPRLPIALIVAVAENGVIGIDNRLPWHLPADLQYFKSRTLGKPIIMGRKTWDSLGRPLPGRLNLVITRQSDWQATGAEVLGNLPDALQRGQQWAQAQGATEVMVIGGAQLFAEALPYVQRLYLTRVALQPEGDVFFPLWQDERWQRSSYEAHPAAEGRPAYAYEVWDRRE